MTAREREIALRYFRLSEFNCPCCGEQHMSTRTLNRLDNAREIAGTPFAITSGWRCPKHNAEVGGKPESAHTTGEAADIAATGARQKFKIVNGLLQAGFTRIGIGKTFVHADDDETKDPEVLWLY